MYEERFLIAYTYVEFLRAMKVCERLEYLRKLRILLLAIYNYRHTSMYESKLMALCTECYFVVSCSLQMISLMIQTDKIYPCL